MSAPAPAIRSETDVAIVGAGPAGLAAAVEVARAGLRVALVDEGARPGGQIFRQAPSRYHVGHDAHAGESPSHQRGAALLRELDGAEVATFHGATVWDAAPDRVSFELAGAAHVLACRRLILAPGAYDLCLPFPGWTLPGVITAGAAQVMVRGFLLRPGQRALVAGTGPLLLPTVTSLLRAGVEVVAALEANSRGAQLRAGLGMLRSGARLREAWHYVSELRRQRVDLRLGWSIVRAEGNPDLRAAVIARIDAEGRVRPGTEQRVDVDLICTGYGLLPSIELARLLGCDMHHVPVRGGWVPRHDVDQQTSVSGVYVAGEIAGIGGSDVAVAEGRIAGLAAARSLGRTADGSAARVRAASRARAKERRVSDALLGAFGVPPGLFDLADDGTVVCRCEDVSFRQLRETARVFGADMRSLKMGSRAGMGPCQGRICQPGVFGLARRRCGATDPVMPCMVAQVPVKPVAVATMLATDSATAERSG